MNKVRKISAQRFFELLIEMLGQERNGGRMDREHTCFFTGHRNLPTVRIEQIRKIIEIKAKNLIEDKGVEHFIAGGALGFDTIAAETIIKVKEEHPHIKLHLYLPCFDQSRRWKYEDKYKWHMMMSKVDDYIYVTESTYTADCMKKRNQKMADDSDYGLAYCVLDKSGTGSTIRYAEQRGVIIDNIAETVYEL